MSSPTLRIAAPQSGQKPGAASGAASMMDDTAGVVAREARSDLAAAALRSVPARYRDDGRIEDAD